jgi:hypothetical protein
MKPAGLSGQGRPAARLGRTNPPGAARGRTWAGQARLGPEGTGKPEPGGHGLARAQRVGLVLERDRGRVAVGTLASSGDQRVRLRLRTVSF